MKRIPSIKSLSAVFEDPKAARAIFEMNRAELLETPAGEARYMECYHPPKTYDIRLEVLNALDPGLCGVEGIENTSGEYATFLNAGDTYTPTVIYWRGSYRIQSIGDFVEKVRGF